MGNEQPALFAMHEYIGGWHHGVVKTIGERGSDVFGARDPSNVAFDAHPDGTQGDANAARVGEKPGPAVMHFFPAEQKFPARVDTLDFFIVGPDSFHLSEVERFKGGIKARVRGTESVFWCLFLLRGLGGHCEDGLGSKFNSNLSQRSDRGPARPSAPG